MTKLRSPLNVVLVVLLACALAAPQGVFAQTAGQPTFKQEEIDQLVAPIALYPDELLVQILMASTYPLEVVQAARWVKANPNLKGDQITAALEQQSWDPSVKSLVNFPSVLQMMNEKLDWTQRLGDAFLAQEKQVMDSIQNLRRKAQAQGSLKTTPEQKVVVEPQTQTIVIEPSNPQVVYVPTYNPTVVYGAWPYPAYPPVYYYPPGYTAGAALFTFAAGVAVGAAWGYAWGGANWGHGDVDVNVWRNTNINNNINRNRYENKVTDGQGGKGQWKHNPESRKGVAYRDQGTAQRFGRDSGNTAQTRDQYRGRADAGRQDPGRGGDQFRGGQGQGMDRNRPTTMDRPAGDRSQGFDRGQGGQTRDTSAFQNYDRGNQARDFSNRGNQSMASQRQSGGFDRGSSGFDRGGGGGASRGGGGGRGGGRR